jgi:mannose-6-phosphate isomerase-like protein (cupin superfamily)
MLSNRLIQKYLEKQKLTIIKNDIRPWGGWYLIDDTNTFDKKIIHVEPKMLLSLQYHGTPENRGHKEIWECCTRVRAIVSEKSVVGVAQDALNELLGKLLVIDILPGGKLIIEPGVIHALVNPFDENLYVIETRVSMKEETSIDREANITRIFDFTNRYGIPSYPQDLINRIMDPDFMPDYMINQGETFFTNL